MGSTLSQPVTGDGGARGCRERKRYSIAPGEVSKFVSANGQLKLNEVHGQLDSYCFVRKRIGEERRSRKAVVNGGTTDFYVARRVSDGHFFALRQVSLKNRGSLLDDGGNSHCSAAEPLSRARIADMVEFVRLRYATHEPLEVVLNRQRGETKAYIIDELMETGVEMQAECLREHFGQRIAGRFYLARLGGPVADIIARGALHGDIKPTNFLAHGATVRLTDFFGASQGQRMQQRGKTDLYLSGPRARTNEVTQRSEAYAVGIAVIELMTGTHPLRGRRGERMVTDVEFAVAWANRTMPHPRPGEDTIARFEDLFAELRRLDEPLGRALERLADPTEATPYALDTIVGETSNGGELALDDDVLARIAEVLDGVPGDPRIEAAKAELLAQNEGRRPYVRARR